jgi:16S rRNA processing protein RimM
MESEEFYRVGRVRRAHGIRGELVVELLTDEPDAIFASGRRVFAGDRHGDLARGAGAQELHVLRATPFKGGLIVAFDGINDKTAADTWRDRYLLVPGSEVSPPGDDELFIHQLVGMRVVKAGGEDVGEVTEVFSLPQGLVIDVRRPNGKSVMLPFDGNTVTDVDSDARIVTVDPVEGLLD